MKQVGKRDECRKGVNVFRNTTFAKDEGSLGMCFRGNNCRGDVWGNIDVFLVENKLFVPKNTFFFVKHVFIVFKCKKRVFYM